MLVLLLGLPCVLHSQGMSELDLQGFSKKGPVGTGTVKNPFSASRSSAEDLLPEDLFLTGVAIGEGRSFALISGSIVREGDAIAGLKVRTISKDRVILQKLDKIHTLYLDGGM